MRAGPEEPWELPGGPLLPEHEDVDAAMDAHLERFGIFAPAIEEDFLETVYLQGEGAAPVVYNLYAATEWRGDPVPPPGLDVEWFATDELEAVAMDATVHEAVLTALGLKEPVDDAAHLLEAVNGAVFGSGTAGATSEGVAGFAGRMQAFVAARDLASEGLQARSRNLQAVAILAALGHSEHLSAHLAAALEAGCTLADLTETLELVATYAGMPVAADAWAVFEDALDGRDIDIPRRPA